MKNDLSTPLKLNQTEAILAYINLLKLGITFHNYATEPRKTSGHRTA